MGALVDETRVRSVNGQTVVRAMVGTCEGPVSDATVTVDFDNGEPGLTLYDNGADPDMVTGDGEYAGFWTPHVLGDVTLTFWLSKFFIGAGAGIFSSEMDTRFDFIVNTGLMLAKHFGLFIEGRVAFDEFDVIDKRARYGGGIRIIF